MHTLPSGSAEVSELASLGVGWEERGRFPTGGLGGVGGMGSPTRVVAELLRSL